jgi:hypothetical protein
MGSLTRSPKPHRGSWIQRLPARACAMDHAVSSAHGSTVDRPLNAKGYVIWAIHARSKGSGRVQAKGDGEHAGVRRRAEGLAGVAPGWHSQPSTRPQASANRRGGACARDRGVKEGNRASSVAGAGRGRRGCSGELVGAPKCSKRRDIEHGFLLTVCRRRRRAQKRREGAGEGTWQRRRIGRRSGGRGPVLQTLRDPGDDFPWTTSVT